MAENNQVDVELAARLTRMRTDHVMLVEEIRAGRVVVAGVDAQLSDLLTWEPELIEATAERDAEQAAFDEADAARKDAEAEYHRTRSDWPKVEAARSACSAATLLLNAARERHAAADVKVTDLRRQIATAWTAQMQSRATRRAFVKTLALEYRPRVLTIMAELEELDRDLIRARQTHNAVHAAFPTASVSDTIQEWDERSLLRSTLPYEQSHVARNLASLVERNFSDTAASKV